MSSFERTLLDWVNPIIVNSNQTNVTITDAITTSQVWEIQIPYTYEYFLIDNHQRVSYYENTWKKYNGGPLVSPGTGILITYLYANSFLEIESAFGKWNWKKSGNLYIYPFEKDTPNKDFGETKLGLRDKNTTAGNHKNHPDYLGSSEDYFNIGYNQLFSPWSNPSTYQDVSNIGVELVSKDPLNNIIVNFYVNNPENAQPAKPQNLNLTVINYHPKLTWYKNFEPDFNGFYIYRTENSFPTEQIAYVPKDNRLTTYTFTDNQVSTIVQPDNISYTIKAVDNTNLLSINSDNVSVMGILMKPKLEDKDKLVDFNFSLSQSFPNPFNPTTSIRYTVPQKGLVILKVYDMLGRKVKTLVNSEKSKGVYTVTFNADNLPTGVYFYSISIGNFSEVKKMVLLR